MKESQRKAPIITGLCAETYSIQFDSVSGQMSRHQAQFSQQTLSTQTNKPSFYNNTRRQIRLAEFEPLKSFSSWLQTAWGRQSGSFVLVSSSSKASFTLHDAWWNVRDLSADLWTASLPPIFSWSFCRSLGRTNVLRPRNSVGTFSSISSSRTTQNLSRCRGSWAQLVTRLRARAKRAPAEAETVWWDTTGGGFTFKSSKKDRVTEKVKWWQTSG